MNEFEAVLIGMAQIGLIGLFFFLEYYKKHIPVWILAGWIGWLLGILTGVFLTTI